MFRRKHHTHKSPPQLWSNLGGLCAWIKTHAVASIMSACGLLSAAGGVWYYWGSAAKALLHPNTARDAAIATNAQKTDSLTTQVYTWHGDSLKTDDSQERQISGIRADLRGATEQMSDLTAAVREENATVKGLAATVDEQNKRLDTLTEIEMRRAMGAGRSPTMAVVPDGPPAPGRGEQ